MGRERSARLHRRRLFGGRCTAEEFHRANAFPPDARCGGCGSPKVAVRARTFYPARDLVARKPEVAVQIASRHDGRLPCVDFRGPGDRPVPHVRVGDAFACDLCAPALEKSLAEGERRDSRIVTHVERGPGPDNLIVQVPR